MDQLNKKLPDTPGVYFFKKGVEILYIGKATSLRDRVRSYFKADVINSRGTLIVQMVGVATSLMFRATDSVLEAVILEAELIKRYQPKYNIRDKDNRSFNFVVITKEEYPRVLIERGRALANGTREIRIKKIFGPFPSGSELREALRITRKIFPFRDKCAPNSGKACFNRQIGLCPGVCSSETSVADYRREIRNIELLFSGKKKKIITDLKKEMSEYALLQKFEFANQIKRQIFALEHIGDISLIKREMIMNSLLKEGEKDKIFRIEAYDVAHHAGSSNVGVMVVVENSQPSRSEYKKFKIRGNYPADDIRSLREVLDRRLNHPEWRFPDLLVVDGGKLQIAVAQEVLDRDKLSIPVLGVVKNDRHAPERVLGDPNIVKKFESFILLANSEAHRFAITYHRKLQSKIK
ncbi:MAG: GIY-YIG nuclease family protein [Candidatus Vogelbacteria bacterium]|nr:GIY-YIG nuclease family protein [Candidatus Vogelbacteria bacterium]